LSTIEKSSYPKDARFPGAGRYSGVEKGMGQGMHLWSAQYKQAVELPYQWYQCQQLCRTVGGWSVSK